MGSQRLATEAVEDSESRLLTVLETLRKYGENPSGFLALNAGNQQFTDAEFDGMIVYRRSGRYLVQFGGVFAAEEDKAALLQRFRTFARSQKCRIVAIQAQPEDIGLFEKEGFTINQVGASYSLDLSQFSLRGTRFMKLRNKISRAKRSGLEIEEVAFESCVDGIDEIDRIWLRSKGRHVKEIEFLVGQVGGRAQRYRRLFLGRIDGAPVAYISYSPAYGTRSGWLHDLSRRLPDSPPGVMEAINLHATEKFAKEKAGWLHFGFTPFTSLDPSHETASASPLTSKFMRLLADKGGAVYPAKTQLAYKEKWGPHQVVPEYLAFEKGPSFGAIWQILRVTKSI